MLKLLIICIGGFLAELGGLRVKISIHTDEWITFFHTNDEDIAHYVVQNIPVKNYD